MNKHIAALIVFAFLGSRPAQAQVNDPRNLDGNRLRLSLGTEGILDVNAGSVPEHLSFDVVLFSDYQFNPITAREIDDQGDEIRRLSLLRERIDAHLLASISLFNWVQLGVSAGYTLQQRRGSRSVTAYGLSPIEKRGIGDVTVTAKVRILDAETFGVDLAVLPGVTIPTADPRLSYLGERGATLLPEIALSRNYGSFRWGINAGARLREKIESGNFDLKVNEEVYGRLGVGWTPAEGPVELDLTAMGFNRADNLFGESNEAGLEFLGGVKYAITPTLSALVGGGVGVLRGHIVPDFRGFVGLRFAQRELDEDGDGIQDNEDNCPEEAEDKDGFEDQDGCPDGDNDGDGVPDAQDAAPNEPEDVDGFEDEDGAPDPDNDQDSILDGDDKCPSEPEVINQFEDNDGCPDDVPDSDGDGLNDLQDKCPEKAEDIDEYEDDDGCPDVDNDGDGAMDKTDGCPNEVGPLENRGCPDTDSDGDGVIDRLDYCPQEIGDEANNGCKAKQLVKITEEKIEILQKVFFAAGRSKIKSRSFSLLDNVAQVLLGKKDLKIEIQGHTDSRGSAGKNKSLSQKRADSVRSYLISKGVPQERLTAKGYGEEKPIDSNKTKRGRANNRRVEFVIAQ